MGKFLKFRTKIEVHKYSINMLICKISKNSQEIIRAGVFFKENKVADLQPTHLLKKGLQQKSFPVSFFEIYQKNVFEEHLCAECETINLRRGYR